MQSSAEHPKYLPVKNNSISLEMIFKPIRKELVKLEKELTGVCNVPEIQPFLAGGKRLRPALVFLSSCFGDGPCAKVARLATAVETLHLATLVHDDIIDHAKSRRSVNTINSARGENTAILTGDYLYAVFLERSAGLGEIVLQSLSGALKDMVQAELAQQKDLFNCAADQKSYLRRTFKKSGSFLACCCKLGAFLAGAPMKTVLALEKFGLHAGISFQITDDLLDFEGRPDTLGKPVGQDLMQGLLTLPVIHVLANSPASVEIRDLIVKRDLHPASIEFITKAMMEAGSLSYTAALARRYAYLAGQVLSALPADSARDSLAALLKFITTREC